jgi:sterol desaturase/sphingolipid hydroxylase (fatty acid hydroxylase superfamily)
MAPSLLSELGRNPTISAAAILAAMALVALLEAVIPLSRRTHWNRAHLVPNLTLTLFTFSTSALFNGALVVGLVELQAKGFGALGLLELGPAAHTGAVLLILDFSFYVAHVAMHKLPFFWRFHAVHHSDPAVDVTTSIRQHPVESAIRYAFMAAFAAAAGASPAAFAVYRIASALNALPEHANVSAPFWLDRVLSLFTTWPNVHKLHHSRDPRETDTNYGNLFSFWDRLFGTFVSPRAGMRVACGLEGFDEPAKQTTFALLIEPFRDGQSAASRDAASSETSSREQASSS